METEIKKLRNKYSVIRNDLFARLGEKGLSNNEKDKLEKELIRGKIRMLDDVLYDLHNLVK